MLTHEPIVWTDEEPSGNEDNFANSKEKIKDANKTLKIPHRDDNLNLLLYAVFYSIRFEKTKKFGKYKDDKLKSVLPNDLFASLDKNKWNLRLDLDYQSFEAKYVFIYDLLVKECYFLRIYESNKKFCLIEKFNGFYIVLMEYDQKERSKFVPINIIFKPVKHQKMKINCYFSTQSIRHIDRHIMMQT